MKKFFTLIAALGLATASFGQVPAQKQSKSMIILGATAHIGNGQVIRNAAIGFRDGKITFVGSADNRDKSIYDEEIQAKGKHIYPGFILANSSLGLTEIDAVRASRDLREVGTYNAHVRSIIAYNTDSEIIPTIRTNGILMAQIAPKGGWISGSSSVVEFDAWNWEDAVYRMDDGIHMGWPSFRSPSFTGGVFSWGPNKQYDEQANTLRDWFRGAAAYAASTDQEEKDLRYEATRGLFDGSSTLFINASRVKEISQAVDFAKTIGIKNITIKGGAEAYLVADYLREKNVSVILQRVHSLPDRSEEDIHQPFKLASQLQKAGVLYCLGYNGDMERMGARNLPFTAGTAAAYGLSKEEAVQAITLNPAKILGIDKTTGSLEVGKDATLFISTGDALDMLTNNIERAFIGGRDLDLSNRQIDLYEKFKTKYETEGK